MKIVLKNREGITLISLVVTVIILLILAGISIGMLSGDNGILGQAGNAKTQTEIEGEKEIINLAVVGAMNKSKYGDIDENKLNAELSKYSGIDGTQETDEGIEVTFSSGRTYLVDGAGNVELLLAKPKIVSSKIVNSSGNEVSEQEEAEQLYIIITPSIDGGTIESLICNEGNTTEKQTDGTYKVAISKNGIYTFKIVGKIDGKESTAKAVPVTADRFKLKTAQNTLITNSSATIKSPYVKYIDKNENEIICRVLYNDDQKGIQIISENPVAIVNLGSKDQEAQSKGNTDYEKAQWSYNNMLTTLNNKAKEYLNTTLSPEDGARCVGSNPITPSSESGEYSFQSGYNDKAKANKLKDTDTNYETDFNQLGILEIRRVSNSSISNWYYLASRIVSSDPSVTNFEIRYLGR